MADGKWPIGVGAALHSPRFAGGLGGGDQGGGELLVEGEEVFHAVPVGIVAPASEPTPVGTGSPRYLR
jgi:hypothetical protein